MIAAYVCFVKIFVVFVTAAGIGEFYRYFFYRG